MGTNDLTLFLSFSMIFKFALWSTYASESSPQVGQTLMKVNLSYCMSVNIITFCADMHMPKFHIFNFWLFRLVCVI